MRSLLITFLCLGFLVMGLGILERAAQVSQWSSVVAWAAEAGVLQNEKFAQHLEKLPGSPFSTAIVGTGLVICVLAIWRLVKETRAKDPPI